ncbi:MAG: hypothetical protein KAW82_02990 [Desulfurellaceae bacterium]|nr:hypothetical protein [Desulfurellaceae bacterium]
MTFGDTPLFAAELFILLCFLLRDAKNINNKIVVLIGMPLSISGKNPFFDRKK